MKKISIVLLLVFILLSCGDNSSDLRNTNDKSMIYGTWEDVTTSSAPGIGLTFKSAVFTFYDDGTFSVDSLVSPLDIFKDGKWDYDEEEKIITFHDNEIPDSLVESSDSKKYNVRKTWEILELSGTDMKVNYKIYRKEDYIYDKNTNEVIDTVSPINVVMSRDFIKIN